MYRCIVLPFGSLSDKLLSWSPLSLHYFENTDIHSTLITLSLDMALWSITLELCLAKLPRSHMAKKMFVSLQVKLKKIHEFDSVSLAGIKIIFISDVRPWSFYSV